MPFVLLLIGVILVVVAYQGTHPQLGAALAQDLPGFFRWAVAIIAILALGFIPGFKTPSRWLLGVIALVIVLTQYQNIIAGLQAFTAGGATVASAGDQPAATPATQYAQQYAPQAAAAASAGGTPTTAQLTAAQEAAIAAANNPFDPAHYASFGGVA